MSPVQRAAKILGCSVNFVRGGLISGRLPIGTAVHTGKQWVFHINWEAVERYRKGVITPSDAL